MYAGRVPEGLALLDEAMVGVAAGELSPIFAGNVYCAMIEGCQEVQDFARAAGVDSGADPLVRHPAGPGAVHRAVRRTSGSDPAAARRVRRGAGRSSTTRAGATRRRVRRPRPDSRLSERGDVLRIRGDFAAAETAYDEAAGFGHEPQPGRALLLLARGRTPAAVAVRTAVARGDDRDRSTGRGCSRERSRCCWPAGASTRPRRSRTSWRRSRPASGARGCARRRRTALALVALERGDPDRRAAAGAGGPPAVDRAAGAVRGRAGEGAGRTVVPAARRRGLGDGRADVGRPRPSPSSARSRPGRRSSSCCTAAPPAVSPRVSWRSSAWLRPATATPRSRSGSCSATRPSPGISPTSSPSSTSRPAPRRPRTPATTTCSETLSRGMPFTPGSEVPAGSRGRMLGG